MSNLSNKELGYRWMFISFLQANEAICMFYYFRIEISNCSASGGRAEITFKIEKFWSVKYTMDLFSGFVLLI